MKVLLLIAMSMVMGMGDQFVPIPKKAYGFSFGAHDGALHIEAFLDLPVVENIFFLEYQIR